MHASGPKQQYEPGKRTSSKESRTRRCGGLHQQGFCFTPCCLDSGQGPFTGVHGECSRRTASGRKAARRRISLFLSTSKRTRIPVPPLSWTLQRISPDPYLTLVVCTILLTGTRSTDTAEPSMTARGALPRLSEFIQEYSERNHPVVPFIICYPQKCLQASWQKAWIEEA